MVITVLTNNTYEQREEEEVGIQHQGMDRPGVWQVPEGSGEQGKMEKTGSKIICGAPMTLAVKELMMMMMITNKHFCILCDDNACIHAHLHAVSGS